MRTLFPGSKRATVKFVSPLNSNFWNGLVPSGSGCKVLSSSMQGLGFRRYKRQNKTPRDTLSRGNFFGHCFQNQGKVYRRLAAGGQSCAWLRLQLAMVCRLVRISPDCCLERSGSGGPSDLAGQDCLKGHKPSEENASLVLVLRNC